MKNRILLEHYYLPRELEARLAEFVSFYNNRRYNESLGNLTPAHATLDAHRPFSKGGTLSNTRPLSDDDDCISKRSLNT